MQVLKIMIKINVYRVLGNLGCNFSCTKKKPVEKIQAYMGLKVPPGYLERAGLDINSLRV